MWERHQFKKKKQLPIVEEAKPLHDCKYVKKPITVWEFRQTSWFWDKRPQKFEWTRKGRYKNERGAMDAIKADLSSSHWKKFKSYYWIGDTPPSE